MQAGNWNQTYSRRVARTLDSPRSKFHQNVWHRLEDVARQHSASPAPPPLTVAGYFGRVLREWADDVYDICLNILREQRRTRTPGLTRTIIHEIVLPEIRTELEWCLTTLGGVAGLLSANLPHKWHESEREGIEQAAYDLIKEWREKGEEMERERNRAYSSFDQEKGLKSRKGRRKSIRPRQKSPELISSARSHVFRTNEGQSNDPEKLRNDIAKEAGIADSQKPARIGNLEKLKALGSLSQKQAASEFECGERNIRIMVVQGKLTRTPKKGRIMVDEKFCNEYRSRYPAPPN